MHVKKIDAICDTSNVKDDFKIQNTPRKVKLV